MSHDFSSKDILGALDLVHKHEQNILSSKERRDALPDPGAVERAVSSLLARLPESGLPLDEVTRHLLSLTDGLSGSSLSSTYYGFVTGGCTPHALVADHLVSLHDQNVMVHLPAQSAATLVEDRALHMLLELLNLDPAQWTGRTLTTGATAGNIQGLACGREAILRRRLGEGVPGTSSSGGGGGPGPGTAELGLLRACAAAGVREIKVLTTAPHSSLAKAASIVGLGRDACIDVRRGQSERDIRFDLARLEAELTVEGRACIVAVSCGEINTGDYATGSHDEFARLRELCDRHGAWLHVDGAFGVFTRLLLPRQSPSDQVGHGHDEHDNSAYSLVARGAAGVHLADSLAGDLHKFLNVPYDCGFFASRHPHVQAEVYRNANAAYLSGAADGIPSPLNVGAENSRRFRGLAVYATLAGFGRAGYARTLRSQIDVARAIARLIDGGEGAVDGEAAGAEARPDTSASSLSAGYTLLNGTRARGYADVATIVLFRAADDALNARLAERINARRSIYVSATRWAGRPACRIAVSNWRANAGTGTGTATGNGGQDDGDVAVVRQALLQTLEAWKLEQQST